MDGDLLDRVCEYVRRFVVVSDQQACAVTLWVVHTHAVMAWDVTGYLFVTSPTLGAGKTRLLEVLESVVPRPWRPVEVSAAGVFRKVDLERPTVLIDEVDALIDSKPLRAVLNSGYRQGGVVTRVERVDGIRVPVDFQTYSAKALAGISGQRLPLHATTLDRTIRIELQRRKPDEHVEQFRRLREVEASQTLHAQLADFARDNFDALCDHEPTIPDTLDDRAAELWWPLMVVAEVVGGEWPHRATEAALALSTNREDDEAVHLLRDIHAVWTDTTATRLPSDALLKRLQALDDPAFGGSYAMSPAALARRLRPFGIGPKMLRVGSRTTKRGYERDMFREAFERYLGTAT